MSLKEWKNNELNGLLLKKFGILKVEKDVKMVPKSEVPEEAEVVVPDGPGDLVGIKKEELNEEEINEEVVEEETELQEEKEGLQEALKKIARAKSITLKSSGKKIK